MSRDREIVLVSSGYDMCIKFWASFNNGSECRYKVDYKDNAINALEMTPNKEFVAFAAGNSIKFIDLRKGEPSLLLSIESHEGLVSTILIPDNFENKFISAGEDSTVRINDIRLQKGIQSFTHANYVNSVAMDKKNTEIIAADENGTIKIWDIRKCEQRTEYKSNINEEGLAFRSISLAENEGFLVGAKSNGTCCVFDYNISQNLTLNNTFEAHKTYITKCLLSPQNNMLATCSADNEMRLWRRKTASNEDGSKQTDPNGNNLLSKNFELQTRFIGHKKWVWDCDFSLDSLYLLSCSSDKEIRIWSIKSGKVISKFSNPKGVNNIALADEE